MTYSTTESSIEGGKPIELYVWDLGTQIVRQCNWHENITLGGVVYTAAKLVRNAVRASNDEELNALDIEMPVTNQVAALFISVSPGQRIGIDILRTHESEIGGTEETQAIYSGFVSAVRFEGLQTAKLRCKPSTIGVIKNAPRMKFTRLCGHILYDARCKVARGSYAYTGTVTAVGTTSPTITVNGASGLGADYWEGGFVEYPPGVGNDHRMITEQSGDVLTLMLPFADDVNGTQVRLFAGCKHDLSTCDTKFSNAINYGGFEYIPSKNPFNSELR